MKKYILTFSLVLGLCVSLVQANTSASFLSMPSSPRETALAGAFGAVNKDMDAITFNPAGISGVDGFGAAFSYNKQIFGNTCVHAALVHPAGFGMLGVSFTFLYIPFETTFEFGQAVAAKSLSDMVLAVAFQRDLIESLSIGIAAKFVSADLGASGGSRATAAGDAGLLYMLNPKAENMRFNIGAGVRNAGIGLKFDKTTESLPMTIYGSMMFMPVRFVSLFGEADKPADMDLEYSAGLELNILGMIKPRVGYRIANGGGLAAGLGLSKEFGSTTLTLDYGMRMNVETAHVVQFKISRPALLEFGSSGQKAIPYDGKEPTKIAISELEVKGGAEADLAGTVAEWLRGDLGKSTALAVLARENMAKIMKEQELQMSGITSEKDAAAIGQVLNVQYMILGSINLVGSEYYLNVKVVNVSTGKVEATAEEVAGSKATIRLSARKLAMKLDPASNNKK